MTGGSSVADDDKLNELADEVVTLRRERAAVDAPVLAMDGIRIATLIMLGVHTIAVVVLSVFLVTNVQSQRQLNECYQDHIDALTSWAGTAVLAGKERTSAQRELLSITVTTPEERRAALDRYLARLDAADQAGLQNPVPTQRCAR